MGLSGCRKTKTGATVDDFDEEIMMKSIKTEEDKSEKKDKKEATSPTLVSECDESKEVSGWAEHPGRFAGTNLPPRGPPRTPGAGTCRCICPGLQTSGL